MKDQLFVCTLLEISPFFTPSIFTSFLGDLKEGDFEFGQMFIACFPKFTDLQKYEFSILIGEMCSFLPDIQKSNDYPK